MHTHTHTKGLNFEGGHGAVGVHGAEDPTEAKGIPRGLANGGPHPAEGPEARSGPSSLQQEALDSASAT